MRFRPKGGSIAAFKSCFAYVRRTYAGALPAELKVHRDFSNPLRWALKNKGYAALIARASRARSLREKYFFTGKAGKKMITLLSPLRRRILRSKSAFHTLKTEQSNRRMPRKRLHVFSNHSRSSPRLISTGQLHTLLHFHLRPIYVIVYDVPYSMKDERSYLRESFTLRCFQRLSRPHLATLLCRWHDNRCTRGASIPVLSY